MRIAVANSVRHRGPKSADALNDPRVVRVRRYEVEPTRRREEPTQSARELFAIAEAARNGIPPAGSPAARQIREALERGEFSRALTLREEVKERAPDLDAHRRAQAKRARAHGAVAVMSGTVQIERITFDHDDDERRPTGRCCYLILAPCTDDPCRHVCTAHPRMSHHYERQAFRLGTSGQRFNATPEEIASNRANVWGWDGNREAPTILPSFVAAEGRPYRCTLSCAPACSTCSAIRP
jgi:hypothetical protein